MKTKENRWLVMILVLSLAINIAALAVGAYNWYCGRHLSSIALHSSDKMDHHFYQVLGLTPAQLVKMDPIAAAFHSRLESLHSAMAEKKDQMVNLLSRKNPASRQIEKLREEMAATQDSIQKLVISHVLEVKAILDLDQQERFFDLLRKSMAQKHDMFHRAGE